MSTQPEALRLADLLEPCCLTIGDGQQAVAAAELRRLFELAHEQHSEIYGLRLQVKNMHALNLELLEALKHIEHNARKSGADMGLALEVASAAIAKAEAA